MKPVGCLSFNPVGPDACDQEAARYRRAHGEVAQANRRAGHRERYRPIPLAVLEVRLDPAGDPVS